MIKLLNKKTVFSLILILTLMLSYVAPVYAEFDNEWETFVKFWQEYVYPYPASSPDLPDPGYDYNTISLTQTQNSTLQNVILKHSLGKMICISSIYDGTDTDCRIVVYSTSGTLLSDRQIYVRNNNNNPAYLIIRELNSTHVIIAILSIATVGGPYYDWMYDIILYNVNTYTEKVVSGGDVGTAGVYSYAKIPGQWSAVKVDDDWYFFISVYDKLFSIKYTYATQAISTHDYAFGSSGTDSTGQPIIVQDPVTDTSIYVMSSTPDDPKTPHYWWIDLSVQSIELLATHPVANCTNDSRNFVTLGGKVDYNDDGYIYVYWSWIYPYLHDSGTRMAKFVQYKQQYNASVTVSELLDTDYYASGLYPGGLGTAGSANMWVLGVEVDYTEYYFWTPYRVSGVDRVMQAHLTISDWYDFGTYTNNVVFNTVAFITNEDPFFPSYRAMDSGIGLIEHDTPHEYHFYHNMPGMLENWDISMTYDPAGDLETNTRYRFTATITRNAEAEGARVARYMNGVQSEVVNASSGTYTFYLTPPSAGIMDIELRLYSDIGYNVYNETFTYLVLSSTVAPTPVEDMTFTLDMFMHWLPVLLLVIVPAVMLGQELGAVGYVTGLFLGVVAGLYAGVLQTWVLYVMLLLISIIAVVYMKGRGGD